MFDVKTGMLIWALEAITLCVVLLALWFAAMRELRALLFWSAGFGLHGAGVMAVAYRNRIPDYISIDLGNMLALLGLGLLAAGIQALDKKPMSPAVLLPALIFSTGMLAPDIRGEFWLRCVFYQACAALAYALCAFFLANRAARQSAARRILQGLQILQCGIALVTAIIIALERPQEFQTVPYIGLFAAASVFSIILSLLLAMRLVVEENELRLRQLADTDPLTGALNRRGFAEAFARMSQENRPEQPMAALVHFDLDHFKKINDRHGHAAGDTVLVAFSQLIASSASQSGALGRLGGEEFACFLRVTGAAEAVAFAGGVRMALNHTRIIHAERPIAVSTSVGISLSAAGTSTLDMMLHGSDRALYAAKAAGRDLIALDCENGAQIISPEDESVISDSTDRQVAELNRMRLIGRS